MKCPISAWLTGMVSSTHDRSQCMAAQVVPPRKKMRRGLPLPLCFCLRLEPGAAEPQFAASLCFALQKDSCLLNC